MRGWLIGGLLCIRDIWGGDGRQAVEGAGDAGPAGTDDVGVDHRGADVAMAEEGLDRADVAAGFEEVGGERVA